MILKIFSAYKVRSYRLKGFTLVELLVASSIFVSVLTIAIGALFSAQGINTRLQETQTILDGVNLATEVMTRDIRYGASFSCVNATPTPITNAIEQSCDHQSGSGGTMLIYKPTAKLTGSTDASKDRIVYYAASTTISGRVVGVIYREEHPFGVPTYKTYQITPTDVNIRNLKFFVHGAESSLTGDFDQPIITTVISGVTIPSKKSIDPVTFNIQTSNTARGLDN